MRREILDQPRALRRTSKAEPEHTESSSDEGTNINLSAATSKKTQGGTRFLGVCFLNLLRGCMEASRRPLLLTSYQVNFTAS